MNTLGLWQIGASGPQRMHAAELDAERDLEGWIERDPALLERDLVIIGRQVVLEGGPLDLLALDGSGRLVLIEIKRERLRREALAQAIDYVSCLREVDAAWLRGRCGEYLKTQGRSDSMSGVLERVSASLKPGPNGREVLIYLVGTSADSGLERMVEYLTDVADISVRVITFSVFRDLNGNSLLAREVHEGSERSLAHGQAKSGSAPTAAQLLAKGEENGVGRVMRVLHDGAIDLGLYVRPYYRSIMFTPMSAKNRCLFTAWNDSLPKQPGAVEVLVDAESICDHFGISEQALSAAAGGTGHVVMSETRARSFIATLKATMAGGDDR